METTPATWQTRFGLTLCPALQITDAIPATAQGVAVIYGAEGGAEKTFLVLESRTGSLRQLCEKRLQTAKLPPPVELNVAFKAETPGDLSPQAVHAACRAQVILAQQLRRELRPAMR